MNRRVVIYSIVLASLMVMLKMLEYKLVIVDHSLELYGVAMAAIFAIVGFFVGNKLSARKEVIVEQLIAAPAIAPDVTPEVPGMAIEKSGLSKRELEILQLMAEGHSNQEIADKIFVSVNTVKTHGSNLFLKLDVQRRTQAVKKAKELNLIP